MDYRPLGDSGLMVSAVGIGCNAFSRRVDAAGVADVLAAARDTGVTLLDTADAYGDPFGGSETLLGEALKGRRDAFVLATKFGGGGHRPRPRRPRVPRATSCRPSRAASAGCRPTTSTSTSCTSPRLHADRGDPLGAHRPGPPGQGPLPRLLELRGLAGRRRRLDRAQRRARALRLGAEPLLPARPRPRGRGGPGLRGVRSRRAALLPAGVRPAHGQVPPRRGGADRVARGPRPRPGPVARRGRLGPDRGA